jgi:cytidylate kinase
MAILVITYEFGSNAEEIGHAIEKQLGYEYLALGSILKEATQSGIKWERFGMEYGDAMPNIWERYDWSFIGYMALVQSIILDHALKDNVVIMAKGANYLLRGIPHALSVRVVAPLEDRIRRVMIKQHTNWEKASYLVKQADREITANIRQVYGEKWENPDAYEIKFDMSIQNIDQIGEVLRSFIMAKNNLKTQEGQHWLEMKALAARVKAAIFTNPSILIPTLEVEAGRDGIVMRGIARSIREHRHIDEEVKNICKGIPVTCEIHYRGVKSFKPHRLI